MLNSILSSVSTTASVTMQELLICTAASLVLGAIIALVYMYRNSYSKGFVMTLVLLPAVVQVVIMMVNGNIGTGIAVAGAFSLVRFRSAPGSARDIASIFTAMAIGLATGAGYIAVAFIFAVIIGAATLVLSRIDIGDGRSGLRELKITIPETVDYTTVFDDLFEKYTKRCELIQVRTTNMGSLYQLHYHIISRDSSRDKEFIDELRCRNGNLNIILGRITTMREEL